MTDTQGALIYTMVLAAVCDGAMSERERNILGEMVRRLPVFEGFDSARITTLVEDSLRQLDHEDGIDRVLGAIARALPARLNETAYAIACDVVAADGKASEVELELLELLATRLEVDRLHAAAIEWGARVRHMKLT